MPWATSLLIGLNVLVFAAMAATLSTIAGFDPIQLVLWGGNSATLDLSGQWWRLLSYQFLHANLLHIVLNMWVMWNVGRLTERLYGSINLLFLYLVSGVFAGLASIVWNPMLVSVGASGSIFGILGALLAFLLRFRNETPSSVLRYWLPVLVFAAYNLFIGATEPSIDNAAHVGGMITGFCLGSVVATPPDRYRRFAFGRVAAAVLIAGTSALLPLWYVSAFNHRPSAFEAFFTSHPWYVEGETKNLSLWQSLGARTASGTISADQTKTEFENNIIPFWAFASSRLNEETKHKSRDETPVLFSVAEFATARLHLAQAVFINLQDNSSQNTQAVSDDVQKTALAQAALDRLKLRDEADSLPVPLSQNAFVVWTKNQIPAFQRKCAAAPLELRRPPPSTDDASDGPAQRHAIGCRAQELFMTGDYKTLDALIGDYKRKLSDLPDGSSRLEGVWNGLDDLFEYGGVTVEEAMRRTSEWRKAVRGSVEPDIAETVMFRAWAYSARGHAFASNVPPQAMQIFAARGAMAEAGLREIARAAANDPMWYALSIGVARDQSIPVDKQRAWFDQGIARFPDYAPIYRQMLTSLMPRWNGSTQDVDSFIRSHSGKNGAIDPMQYADHYRMYGNLEGNDYSVIEKSDPDPDLLKMGMTELIERHPRSDYVLNSVARMACAGHEFAFYRSLRSKLNGHISSAAWPDKLSVESCNKWNS